MRAALWANLFLVGVALVAPRMGPGNETAALLFAVPMALTLVIGAAAAIHATILARRENRLPGWRAFLPLSVFLLGIAGTLGLVYSDLTFVSKPVEVLPAQR